MEHLVQSPAHRGCSVERVQVSLRIVSLRIIIFGIRGQGQKKMIQVE